MSGRKTVGQPRDAQCPAVSPDVPARSRWSVWCRESRVEGVSDSDGEPAAAVLTLHSATANFSHNPDSAEPPAPDPNSLGVRWAQDPQGPHPKPAHRMATTTLRTTCRRVRRLKGRKGAGGLTPLSGASGSCW